jgi:hypothetical protein
LAKFGRMLGTGDGWIEVAVGPSAIAGSHPQVRGAFLAPNLFGTLPATHAAGPKR